MLVRFLKGRTPDPKVVLNIWGTTSVMADRQLVTIPHKSNVIALNSSFATVSVMFANVGQSPR